MPYLFETEEHAAVRATARRFAQTHIAPKSAEWEEAEEFPVGKGAFTDPWCSCSSCSSWPSYF